jgi:hypothetical protein
MDALWGFGAAVLALVAGAWSLRIWDWRPGTPFTLDGDGPFVAMQLRDLTDHGWYWSNPDLGFPFGQTGSLFPELNILHMGIVKLLGFVSSDPFTPGVVYFVLGFPLAAAAMFALARSQGLSRWAAAMVGVLFATAPGHQERFPHLWLAAYWVVPLGMWLVLEVLRGNRFFERNAMAHGIRSRVSTRGVLAVGAAVVVGLSGVYYVMFTLLLLATAMLARRWQTGTLRGALPGVVPGALLTAVFLVPVLLARWGSQAAVLTGRDPTQRSFVESETYAGKMMDLVLPWTGHRLDPLAFLSFAYNTSPRATVETSALGVIGAIGWVSLVVVALSSALGVARPQALRQWSVLTLVATALYTVGGLGAWVALFITPQARTWSRVSLYLLLLALLAVGWWLTRLESRRGALVAGALAVGLALVGVLDQTNPDRAPDHSATAARFASAQRYTAALEQTLGRGCPVFQLPVVPFPESAGRGEMKGYDQLLPYLASHDLRFSSGAMRGTTAADWQLGVDLDDPDRLADDLAAAGFCAVEVDTQGFDSTTDPRDALTAALGAPVAQSTDGVYVAYALPSAPPRPTDKAAAILHPVVVALDAYETQRDGSSMAQWVGPDVGLRVVNLGDTSVPVTVSMSVEGVDSTPRELTITDSSGSVLVRRQIAPAGATAVSIPVDAPAGTSTFRIRVSGDPVRQADGQLVSARARDLTATSSDAGARVVSMQEQARSGVVVP